MEASVSGSNDGFVSHVEALVDQVNQDKGGIWEIRDFLASHSREIEQGNGVVTELFTNHLVQLVRRRPEILEVETPMELKTFQSRTGRLPPAGQHIYVAEAMAGNTPSPIRTREEMVKGKEVRYIPKASIIYATRVNTSTGNDPFDRAQIQEMASVLSSVSLSKCNELLAEEGYSVRDLSVGVRMVLFGLKGSRIIELPLGSSEESLTQLQTIMEKVYLTVDQGDFAPAPLRLNQLVDTLLDESLNKPILPIIFSEIVNSSSHVVVEQADENQADENAIPLVIHTSNFRVGNLVSLCSGSAYVG